MNSEETENAGASSSGFDPEELKDDLFDSIIDGDEPTASALTQEGLAEGIPAAEILYDALIPALEEVGSLFEKGTYFVPEMLLGAKAMKAGLALLRPLLAQSGIQPVGTYMILTVKGDIHDIGKDLVRTMLEGGGFRVIDLGVNVTPETMVAMVREHKPDILGFSAFLTTTMPMFKTNVEALVAAGLRDTVKIMVGGAPITEEYARLVGADGFADEASTATRIATDFMRNPETSPFLLQKQQKEATRSFVKADTSGYVMPRPARSRPANPPMSSLERVLTTLKHQEPDRVPHFEWVHDVDVVKAMTHGGGYHDLIEQYDIDGVMVAPAYRKQTLGEPDLLVDEWGAVRRIGKDNYAMPVDDQAPLRTLEDLKKWQVPDPDDDFRYEPIRQTSTSFGGNRATMLQMPPAPPAPRAPIAPNTGSRRSSARLSRGDRAATSGSTW